jgi:hypothetical protein
MEKERTTMTRTIGKALTQIGVLTSRPAAFALVFAYGVLWATIEPHSLNWHGFATLATWMMTLFI